MCAGLGGHSSENQSPCLRELTVLGWGEWRKHRVNIHHVDGQKEGVRVGSSEREVWGVTSCSSEGWLYHYFIAKEEEQALWSGEKQGGRKLIKAKK